MISQESRSYAMTALLSLVLAVLAIALICFLVDPYKLYPSVPRLSPDRSVDLFYHLRLHKPYALTRADPDHLIAGSSRAARLPPSLLQVDGDRAYNAALPGVTLREIRRAIEHAHALKPLKSVVIGLDYYMFREGHSRRTDHYEDARWRKPEAGALDQLRHGWQRFEDSWRSLLSVDALLDSWQALYGAESSQRVYRDDGTWGARVEGVVPPQRLYRMLARQKYGDFTAKTDSLEMDELIQLLDFATRNGIRVRLLISPMQGLILHAVYLAGKWEHYLAWQRHLTELVSGYAPGVTLYGLENRPALVLETMEAEAPLFRDGVHYTRRAGEAILACLLSPCSSELAPTPLDESSIEPYLRSVDELRRRYLRQNPDDVARLRRWLKLG